MNIKGRYWAFIVYPDSVKENWIEELTEIGVVCAISPLHDKDINPDNTIKKPHYHVLIEYDGPTSYNTIKESICDKIGGTIPKRVVSLRGYYRYLTHMDNPEKAQYKQEDIKKIGGFNLDLTTTEIVAIKVNIINDIEENKIVEYCDLINYYLYTLGDMERLEVATNHTYFFDKYINSKRNKMKDEQIKQTGLHNIQDRNIKKEV